MDTRLRDGGMVHVLIACMHSLVRYKTEIQKKALCAAGCAKAIAAAMMAYTDSTGHDRFLKDCTETLEHLLHKSESETQTQTRDFQARLVADGVADAMMTCMSSSKYCYGGTMVLRHIIVDHPENMARIGKQAMHAMAQTMLLVQQQDADFVKDNANIQEYVVRPAGICLNSAWACDLGPELQNGFGEGGGHTSNGAVPVGVRRDPEPGTLGSCY
jgi:hypothetical protein